MKVETIYILTREDLADKCKNLPIEEINMDSFKIEVHGTGHTKNPTVNNPFVIFIETDGSGDTKLLKNRYGKKGVVREEIKAFGSNVDMVDVRVPGAGC